MYKKKLVEDILLDQFGEVVEKVGTALLLHGVHTFKELGDRTKLTRIQLRNALAVLIQHNIVSFMTRDEYHRKIKTEEKYKEDKELEKERLQSMRRKSGQANVENDEPKIYYYQIDPGNVLMRLRFSKFVAHVREKFGENAELVLEELLEHGRLTFEDLINKIVQRKKQVVEDFNETAYKSSLKIGFDNLVKERYIRRVDEINDQDDKLQNKPKKESKKKESKKKKKESEEEGTKKKKKSKKSKRKRSEDDDEEMEDDKPEKKQKTGQVEQVLETNVFDSPEALWRVNYDQFVRTARNEAIVDFISKKINALAGKVMRAMLDISSPYERTRKDPTSKASIRFDDIREQMIKEEEDISERNLSKLLEIMSSDANGYIQNLTTSNQGSYIINLETLSNIVKRLYTESIIEQKYGLIGARIFRMLLAKHQMEQKQISTKALIHMNEARTLLYKMYQDSMVQLQEVPKSSDRHPTRTFYLWYVNIDRVHEKLVETMYKTVRNLRIRLSNEQKEALIKLGGNTIANLSAAQQEYLQKLGKIEDRLESKKFVLYPTENTIELDAALENVKEFDLAPLDSEDVRALYVRGLAVKGNAYKDAVSKKFIEYMKKLTAEGTGSKNAKNIFETAMKEGITKIDVKFSKYSCVQDSISKKPTWICTKQSTGKFDSSTVILPKQLLTVLALKKPNTFAQGTGEMICYTIILHVKNKKHKFRICQSSGMPKIDPSTGGAKVLGYIERSVKDRFDLVSVPHSEFKLSFEKPIVFGQSLIDPPPPSGSDDIELPKLKLKPKPKKKPKIKSYDAIRNNLFKQILENEERKHLKKKKLNEKLLKKLLKEALAREQEEKLLLKELLQLNLPDKLLQNIIRAINVKLLKKYGTPAKELDVNLLIMEMVEVAGNEIAKYIKQLDEKSEEKKLIEEAERMIKEKEEKIIRFALRSMRDLKNQIPKYGMKIMRRVLKKYMTKIPRELTDYLTEKFVEKISKKHNKSPRNLPKNVFRKEMMKFLRKELRRFIPYAFKKPKMDPVTKNAIGNALKQTKIYKQRKFKELDNMNAEIAKILEEIETIQNPEKVAANKRRIKEIKQKIKKYLISEKNFIKMEMREIANMKKNLKNVKKEDFKDLFAKLKALEKQAKVMKKFVMHYEKLAKRSLKGIKKEDPKYLRKVVKDYIKKYVPKLKIDDDIKKDMKELQEIKKQMDSNKK